MDKKQKLFEIADSQQGYFTAQQAVECGYFRSNFMRKIKSQDWARVERGIYRLVQYPISDRPDLVIWSLWSRSKDGEILGVWSHDTALSIHNLSDIMPARLHMSLPPNTQKNLPTKGLKIYYQYLHPSEVQHKQGFLVTTPLKTILNCIQSATISNDLILQALRESQERGLILEEDIHSIRKIYPDEYKKIQDLLNV